MLGNLACGVAMIAINRDLAAIYVKADGSEPLTKGYGQRKPHITQTNYSYR